MYYIKPILKERGYNLSKLAKKIDVSMNQFLNQLTIKQESEGVDA